MNPNQLATIMRLVAKQSTVAAMCKATGMTRQTIYKALRALEASKVARITDWHTDDTGRAVEPVWALGDEPSVPRRRYTDAQKQKLYRQRQRKGVEVMQSVAQAIVGRDSDVKADLGQK